MFFCFCLAPQASSDLRILLKTKAEKHKNLCLCTESPLSICLKLADIYYSNRQQFSTSPLVLLFCLIAVVLIIILLAIISSSMFNSVFVYFA